VEEIAGCLQLGDHLAPAFLGHHGCCSLAEVLMRQEAPATLATDGKLMSAMVPTTLR
jgi:hypothetical protein